MIKTNKIDEVKSPNHQMLQGTMILTITSLIVKILSAVYRVPFQNLVGDEGFYVYQQVYPIYGIGMTLALSGLPVYLSKLIAAEEKPSKARQYTYLFFVMVSVLSFIAFLVLFLGSNQMALLMGDVKLASSIRAVSFLYLVVPFLASYRGGYQGQLNMRPTAFSQLVEQGVRVIIILLAGAIYTVVEISIYKVGMLAMLGSVFGAIGGLLVLIFMNREGVKLFEKPQLTKQEIQRFFRRLLSEGGTLCIFSAYLVFFQLVDSFAVKNALEISGVSELLAKTTKGIYDRGQPLVQVGLVISVSMTTTFIPLLTRYFANNQEKSYEKLVQSFLKLSFTVSSAAGVGLALVLPYINVTLFKDNKEGLSLSLYALSVFFVAMIQAYQAIYQSRNRVKLPFLAAIVGLFVKLMLTANLTIAYGTVGTSLSTIIGLATCLIAMHLKLKKDLEFSLFSWTYYVKIGITLGSMIALLSFYQRFLAQWLWIDWGRMVTLLLTLVGVGLGVGIVIICLIHLKIFTTDEWDMLPGGKKMKAKFKR
ncbi:putative polysaccharide biosynthesis protein [Vagococcus silagei]|uniref:Polysaccharide biosynthesis protein n=1 Tax=Vagococcus silagei TaxID=2508885 RepID=A0A4S3B0F0_9ENTE|nr:polysaccharide biosynthesis protein [Vagococcus silagei]THB60242.1 polysaccharide biosynthesis protein [Vagococcus silagei]